MRALGSMGASLEVIKQLTEMLAHHRDEVRLHAIHAIGGLSTAVTAEMLDDLSGLLCDDYGVWQFGNLQITAIDALEELNHAVPPSFAEHLIYMLNSQRGSTRQIAIKIIDTLGSAAATPALLDCLETLLRDPRPSAQMSAAKAVDALQQATPPICESLFQLTRNEHVGVRAAALRALGAAGGAAQ